MPAVAVCTSHGALSVHLWYFDACSGGVHGRAHYIGERDFTCGITLLTSDCVEFKEIRKEWKARKKEEENQRKVEEDRQRQQAIQQPPQHPDTPHTSGPDSQAQQHPSAGGYGQGVRQLPPIGYAPASGQVAGQYGGQAQPGMEGMPPYPGNQVPYQANYPPASPYGQQGPNQMYAHPQAQQNMQSPAGAPPNPPNHQGDQSRS